MKFANPAATRDTQSHRAERVKAIPSGMSDRIDAPGEIGAERTRTAIRQAARGRQAAPPGRSPSWSAREGVGGPEDDGHQDQMPELQMTHSCQDIDRRHRDTAYDVGRDRCSPS
jgi:hypothetical protein